MIIGNYYMVIPIDEQEPFMFQCLDIVKHTDEHIVKGRDIWTQDNKPLSETWTLVMSVFEESETTEIDPNEFPEYFL